jgi:tetratricopeptide (TPR) repeat protein
MNRTMLALVLLALWAPVGGGLHAAEPWYQSYESGIKAIESRRWALAETKLRAAIKEGPRPGRKVRAYGLRFVDYLPGYYLGMACFNQQKYKEALDELRLVEVSGLVARGDPEFERMTEMIEKSASLVAKPEAGLPRPTAAEPGPARSASQQEADTLIRYARDLLNHGDLDEAGKALESARAKDPDGAAVRDLSEALARMESAHRLAAQREARSGEEAKTAEGEMLVEGVNRLIAARDYDEARRLITRARAGGTGGPQLDELGARVDFAEGLAGLSGLVAKRRWTEARQKAATLASERPRDPELRRLQALIDTAAIGGTLDEPERAGLRAFYAGRYEMAAAIFGQIASGPSRSARALFYLGCSSAALGLLKGRDGKELLNQARQQFAEARRLDRRLAYDQRYISPRIARFFVEVR